MPKAHLHQRGGRRHPESAHQRRVLGGVRTAHLLQVCHTTIFALRESLVAQETRQKGLKKVSCVVFIAAFRQLNHTLSFQISRRSGCYSSIFLTKAV
jgi:hypothetical protein